jgi:hypothetical protein
MTQSQSDSQSQSGSQQSHQSFPSAALSPVAPAIVTTALNPAVELNSAHSRFTTPSVTGPGLPQRPLTHGHAVMMRNLSISPLPQKLMTTPYVKSIAVTTTSTNTTTGRAGDGLVQSAAVDSARPPRHSSTASSGRPPLPISVGPGSHQPLRLLTQHSSPEDQSQSMTCTQQGANIAAVTSPAYSPHYTYPTTPTTSSTTANTTAKTSNTISTPCLPHYAHPSLKKSSSSNSSGSIATSSHLPPRHVLDGSDLFDDSSSDDDE